MVGKGFDREGKKPLGTQRPMVFPVERTLDSGRSRTHDLADLWSRIFPAAKKRRGCNVLKEGTFFCVKGKVNRPKQSHGRFFQTGSFLPRKTTRSPSLSWTWTLEDRKAAWVPTAMDFWTFSKKPTAPSNEDLLFRPWLFWECVPAIFCSGGHSRGFLFQISHRATGMDRASGRSRNTGCCCLREKRGQDARQRPRYISHHTCFGKRGASIRCWTRGFWEIFKGFRQGTCKALWQNRRGSCSWPMAV